MKLSYAPKADALYILLKDHGVERTVRVGPDVAIDYGPDGEIHGIELLAASEHFGLKDDSEVIVENLNVAAK